MSLVSKNRSIHFIGIGGIGMSGLAELLLKLGHRVSGSDIHDSESLSRLRGLGARIQIGHSDQVFRFHQPDTVVYSSAVVPDNPELRYARDHSVPIIRRAEMLGELMRLKQGIAIAGSHGKTTTTGLASLILRQGGLDPTVVIGGKFDAIGSNAMLGLGNWLVAEADESDGSFNRLSPEIGVVTNIDREHLDHYGSFDRVIQAYEDFIDRLPFYGKAILCSDCPNLRGIRARIQKPRSWYGFEKEFAPDFLIELISEGATPRFRILTKTSEYKEVVLELELKVPGRHNVLNATAACLVALELGISPVYIVKALGDFSGVRRRFEKKGVWQGHDVVEDYAHHPTEIRATLEAARSVYAGKDLVVIFQPHRYSRTRDLWNEFATCFSAAQVVLTLPIYAASEERDDWTTQFDREHFSEHILKNQPSARVEFCDQISHVVDEVNAMRVRGEIKEGAPILILGAGDISKLPPMFLK